MASQRLALLLALALSSVEALAAAKPPTLRSGGTCLSSVLAPTAQPLFASRQGSDGGADFQNFQSLSPRFALYDDGHWLVQALRWDGNRYGYGVAWGEVDAVSLDAFRRFLDDPEIRAWLVCNAGEPRDFTARERKDGEMLVRVAGGLRYVPASRLLADLRRGAAAGRIVATFRTLGDWIAALSARGEAMPDRAFVSYRTITGGERFYAALNRSGPIPEWPAPPGFPGTPNLSEEDCRLALGAARFWCDGWSVAELRSCAAVDELVERANDEGNVFRFDGATREFALVPLFPGIAPLDPSILLRQKP